MKASPTFAEPGQPVKSRIIFAVDVAHKWKKQQGEGDQHSPFTPHKEVTAALDRHQRRRMKIQDPVRHFMLICGADAPPGRAPRGNLQRRASKATASEKGEGKDTKGASHSNNIPLTAAILRNGLYRDALMSSCAVLDNPTTSSEMWWLFALGI